MRGICQTLNFFTYRPLFRSWSRTVTLSSMSMHLWYLAGVYDHVSLRQMFTIFSIIIPPYRELCGIQSITTRQREFL